MCEHEATGCHGHMTRTCASKRVIPSRTEIWLAPRVRGTTGRGASRSTHHDQRIPHGDAPDQRPRLAVVENTQAILPVAHHEQVALRRQLKHGATVEAQGRGGEDLGGVLEALWGTGPADVGVLPRRRGGGRWQEVGMEAHSFRGCGSCHGRPGAVGPLSTPAPLTEGSGPPPLCRPLPSSAASSLAVKAANAAVGRYENVVPLSSTVP